ncbi:Uu.00g120020.m01.CDS01 [Anthostomella pinea]|uniref:Uu.00g120020.m01.CDS01 n=1 Tax=Anthostomella pinea TaxID=933095 RepID=A0AAI8VGS0_9PEZI|nr:Uu.00g120020.m01.CDS01 [Anthostomella pinea]
MFLYNSSTEQSLRLSRLKHQFIGHVNVVKQLLEKGADYEAKDSNHGQTPLSWAAE